MGDCEGELGAVDLSLSDEGAAKKWLLEWESATGEHIDCDDVHEGHTRRELLEAMAEIISEHR